MWLRNLLSLIKPFSSLAIPSWNSYKWQHWRLEKYINPHPIPTHNKHIEIFFSILHSLIFFICIVLFFSFLSALLKMLLHLFTHFLHMLEKWLSAYTFSIFLGKIFKCVILVGDLPTRDSPCWPISYHIH
jgi:hypothetical protein